jgi:hypothetical protein
VACESKLIFWVAWQSFAVFLNSIRVLNITILYIFVMAGLLLLPVKDNPGRYRRVGIAEVQKSERVFGPRICASII